MSLSAINHDMSIQREKRNGVERSAMERGAPLAYSLAHEQYTVDSNSSARGTLYTHMPPRKLNVSH